VTATGGTRESDSGVFDAHASGQFAGEIVRASAGEVGRLRIELERANSELGRSLEENARMRGYLARVLQNLPCGVLVVGAEGVQILNPEARR
jgi:nitrogen fixation/metabolism regulation signal transduction histidine kinase